MTSDPAAEGEVAAPAAAEPTPDAHAGTPDEAPAPWTASSILSAVTKFGPPITIVTALMLYFGWARADAQSKAMGIDVSMFGYTTQDYVLRSLSTLYLPLLALAGLGLAWLSLHRRVAALAAEPGSRHQVRRAARGAIVAGVVVALLALLSGWLQPNRWMLAVPLTLAAGVAVAAYGSHVVGLTTDQVDGRRPAGTGERTLRAVLVTGVLSLAMFWELSSYAGVVGRGYAERLAQTINSLPRVTVTSPDPLGVQAPGVSEQAVTLPVADGKGTVRYRTTGLRLLVSSGGRVFLLNDGWRPGTGVVVVLPDDPQLHWQLAR